MRNHLASNKLETKYKLIKQKTDKPTKKYQARLYLFECKPQKRTVLRGTRLTKSPILISLNKHYFYIRTEDNLIKSVYMGDAYNVQDNKYNYYKIKGCHFNNFVTDMNCGYPPYIDMNFTKKDFPEFLELYWQSLFLHYKPKNYDLAIKWSNYVKTTVLWKEKLKVKQ